VRLNKLLEGKEKNEVEFKDEEPGSKLPDIIITKIERKIRDNAKDYSKDWESALDLVNFVLNELNIRIPVASDPRWPQYLGLIRTSVDELTRARGIDAKWSTAV